MNRPCILTYGVPSFLLFSSSAGAWKNGLPHDRVGRLTFASGLGGGGGGGVGVSREYVGSFREGRRTGFGMLVTTKEVYVGNYH